MLQIASKTRSLRGRARGGAAAAESDEVLEADDDLDEDDMNPSVMGESLLRCPPAPRMFLY